MLTPNGPKVLEYNCRFGDPETQVQMLRLEDDLADVCLKVARGNLGDTKLNWLKEAAACVVIAVDGYPDDFPKGQEVVIDPIDDPAVTIFHAGNDPARRQDGQRRRPRRQRLRPRRDALRGAGESVRGRAEGALRRRAVPEGHRVSGAGTAEGVASSHSGSPR